MRFRSVTVMLLGLTIIGLLRVFCFTKATGEKCENGVIDNVIKRALVQCVKGKGYHDANSDRKAKVTAHRAVLFDRHTLQKALQSF